MIFVNHPRYNEEYLELDDDLHVVDDASILHHVQRIYFFVPLFIQHLLLYFSNNAFPEEFRGLARGNGLKMSLLIFKTIVY